MNNCELSFKKNTATHTVSISRLVALWWLQGAHSRLKTQQGQIIIAKIQVQINSWQNLKKRLNQFSRKFSSKRGRKKKVFCLKMYILRALKDHLATRIYSMISTISWLGTWKMLIISTYRATTSWVKSSARSSRSRTLSKRWSSSWTKTWLSIDSWLRLAWLKSD